MSDGFSNAVGPAVFKTFQESKEIQSYMTDPAFVQQISGIAADALHAEVHGESDPPPEAGASE